MNAPHGPDMLKTSVAFPTPKRCCIGEFAYTFYQQGTDRPYWSELSSGEQEEWNELGMAVAEEARRRERE